MKLLKDWKSIFISMILSSMLVVGALHTFAVNQEFRLTEPSIQEVSDQKVQKPLSVNHLSDNLHTANLNPDNHATEHQTAIQPDNDLQSNPALRKNAALPGLFRGDWGPTPIYAKEDRVNFERGAYLSLIDGNQNQPPSTSNGYWRLVKEFKALHEENCFNPAPGIDLGECDFTADAESLTDRDLRKANLKKTLLNGELGTADLSGANLSGATIFGKLVIGPDTRMTGANLSYLQSDGNNPVVGENANLAGVNFTKANLYGAKFSHADLSQGNFPEAVLTGSDLASADLNNADLSKADMTYGILTEAKLNQALLSGANLEEADMRHADVSQAKLQQANLANVQLAGVNFSGADLRGANLSGAHGADTAVVDAQTNFTAAICPDGVTVDGTQVTTCVGHGF